jgi:transposase
MQMRDTLGTIYADVQFADLYPTVGQPAEAPWCLALVTIMQFAENLTDRQAAEAVRGRIDWKYALGLELPDAGFNFSVLSEFRARLIVGRAEERLLTQMLDLFVGRGLLKARGRQCTDSTLSFPNIDNTYIPTSSEEAPRAVHRARCYRYAVPRRVCRNKRIGLKPDQYVPGSSPR